MSIVQFPVWALVLLALLVSTGSTYSSEFDRPWTESDRALIIDAYEFNEIDLPAIAKDDRIAALIHKASDGVPPSYWCKSDEIEQKLCKQTWRRYAVGRELYHTRRALAKALGLKWGAYHLGRPDSDPLDQARHFLDYAAPADDEVIVLDIEDNDPENWMSLPDAERFAQYIYNQLGRWPMLYTNGSTAQFIAANRSKYRTLSRLPLWYARYKPNIESHFPKGNWKSYTIWQFQAQTNCNAKRCPYRVKGANNDIDVNVADMSVGELRQRWPFDQLVPVLDDALATDSADYLASIASTSKSRENVVNTTRDIRLSMLAAYRSFGQHRSTQQRQATIEKNVDQMAQTLFVVIEKTVITPSMMGLASGHLVAAHSRGHNYTPAPVDPMRTSSFSDAR